MTEITKNQARQLILSKQGLLGDYRFVGKEGALAYVKQAGCIQYDPVDVCGKNAELSLQSRVKGFEKQMLHELLYQDRRLVDYSDKEIAIFEVEDWPYFSGYRERSKEHGQSFEKIPELEEQALEFISQHGPVSSDTLPIEGQVFWHSSMHWSGNWHKESQAARSVLEQLYTDGVLIIHHKTGSRKFYDLASKYIDEDILAAENPCADEMDFIKWRICRRIGAIGLLWNRRSDAFLGIAMEAEQREEAFSQLLASETIHEIRVEGIRWPLYMLATDKMLLEAVLTGELDTKARLEFLAPLDPMLWDRKLIEALWDYRYSWEIYTPAAKRKYSYYVLPMMYGEDFIGRIEAIADRKTHTLTVKNIWYEPGVRKTKKLDRDLDKAIRRFAGFNLCTDIV